MKFLSEKCLKTLKKREDTQKNKKQTQRGG